MCYTVYTAHSYNQTRNRVRDRATKENLKYLSLSAHVSENMTEKFLCDKTPALKEFEI